MASPLQHCQAPSRAWLSPTGTGSLHANRPEADHALTFELDHSAGVRHIESLLAEGLTGLDHLVLSRTSVVTAGVRLPHLLPKMKIFLAGIDGVRTPNGMGHGITLSGNVGESVTSMVPSHMCYNITFWYFCQALIRS